MRLTRSHALFWAAKKSPQCLKPHAQQVSIDLCVNDHAPKVEKRHALLDAMNLVSLLKMVRKNHGEAHLPKYMSDLAACSSDKKRRALTKRWLKKMRRHHGIRPQD